MKQMFKRFLVCMCALFLTCVGVVPSWGADDACMSEDNDMIGAPFVLCSTHAYNIGMTENPDASDRELMREVVGLKTTFFTQQMYKQYEQMELMVRRLKTQLQKAVLHDKLQVASGATGNSDDDNDDSAPANRYIKLSGAQDCTDFWSKADKFKCLSENYNLVKNQVRTGNPSTDHRKQVANDYGIACGGVGETKCPKNAENEKCKKTTKNKKDFDDCFRKLQSLISTGMADAQQEAAILNNPFAGWGPQTQKK